MPTRLRAALAALLVLFAARPADAQGWSTAPLRAPTPTPKDGLPGDRAAFNVWLREHRNTLTPTESRLVRERLYVYVSAEAKVRGGALPAPGDTNAISPFVLAGGFGDPGAFLVTAHWTAAPPPYELTQRGLKVRFVSPYLVAGSEDDAWRVCYPFFFMTEPVGMEMTANGVRAETVILSTLVAPDKSPAGASAAHVFVTAAPVADSARFVSEVVQRMELKPMGHTEAPGAWYQGPDNAARPTVAVVRRLPRRIVVIAYTGVRGTFEVNRPHFETLVARLGTGACAP
ncbi:MAG: hypothetical protein HY275_15530 [Gemmatimonadetes bacterium]|nr:hypothetical protein [Gemmatimonadota bacterium]